MAKNIEIDNVFMREVVNGRMVVVERLKVKHLLAAQNQNIPEDHRFAHIAAPVSHTSPLPLR